MYLGIRSIPGGSHDICSPWVLSLYCSPVNHSVKYFVSVRSFIDSRMYFLKKLICKNMLDTNNNNDNNINDNNNNDNNNDDNNNNNNNSNI